MDRIKKYCEANNLHHILNTDIKSFIGIANNNIQPPTEEEIANAKEIWVDASYDPIMVEKDPWLSILTDIKKVNPRVKALTCDFTYWYKTDPEIIYCPYWFMTVYPLYNFKPKTARRFKFSCLNRELKPHRLMNFCLFMESEYLADSCISFWGRAMYANLTEEEHRANLYRMLKKCNDSELDNIFAKVEHLIPYKPYEPEYAGGNDHGMSHLAYTDTYINLVTETSCDFIDLYVHCDAPILTEKTIKPLMCRQMFLMCAQTGAVQFMRDLGFDMFDDVIDHSYDKVEGFVPKTYAIHQELQRLSKLDLAKIFEQNSNRLEHNYLRLFRPEFKSLITKQMK
jgi:hypothetical protein